MTVDQKKLAIRWAFDPKIDLDTPYGRKRAERIAQIREITDLRFSGRLDELMERFSPDCEMNLGDGTRVNPLSGRYRGRDEVSEKLRSLDAIFDRIQLEIVSIIVEKDDVAVRWKCQARNENVQTADWLEGMSVLQFRDGLIAYYGNFLDTALAMRFIR